MDPQNPISGYDPSQSENVAPVEDFGASLGASLGGALQSTGPSGAPDEKERLWAMLVHLSFMFLGVVAPLVLLFATEAIVGKDSAFVKHAAKQALIWQLAAILISCTVIGPFFMVVFAVLAAIAANKGEWHTYPGLASFADK